jgi:hypothetical protein
MACNYLWTWQRIFKTKYLLDSRWSVNVFSFANLKNRVMIIRVSWAFFNALGAFSSSYWATLKPLIVLFKSSLNKETGNCWQSDVHRNEHKQGKLYLQLN